MAYKNYQKYTLVVALHLLHFAKHSITKCTNTSEMMHTVQFRAHRPEINVDVPEMTPIIE